MGSKKTEKTTTVATPVPSRRRPNGLPPIPNHSIRVPDEIWDGAKEKSRANGETMAGLLNRFLVAYLNGELE